MSNYLANIAARTILSAPQVRPRLRGRFDPVAPPTKGALDQSMVDRTFSRAPLDEIESSTPNEQPRALGRSAKPTIDRLRPEPSSSIEQAEKEVTDSRITGFHTAETRPTPVPVLHAQIEPKPSAQSISDRGYETVRPAKSSITAETTTPAQLTEVTTAISKPRNFPEAGSTVSKPLEQPQRVHPNQSLGAIEPAPRFDPEASPYRSHYERFIEREIETVVVHENPKQIDNHVPSVLESSRHHAARTTAEKIIEGETRRTSIVIQPRVEPLAGFRPERQSVHQLEQHMEPTVHVTIGRIEVRAVQQPLQSSAKPRATQPVMNLDDYLRRRSQGNGR